MASKFKPRKVSKSVGLNPIAQAVARKRVHDSIRDTRIAIHLLSQGDGCLALMLDAVVLFKVMQQVAKTTNLLPEADKVLATEVLSKAQAVAETMKGWNPTELPVLDEALDLSDDLYQTLPATAINEAIKNLMGGS